MNAQVLELTQNSLPSISPRELRDRLERRENLTILDIRFPEEWDITGLIPGSTLIPMDQLILAVQNGISLVEREPIIIACQGGERSAMITQYLIEQGVEAYNLSAGIRGYQVFGGLLIDI
jgi:rhodanese-related sulfurtransferase